MSVTQVQIYHNLDLQSAQITKKTIAKLEFHFFLFARFTWRRGRGRNQKLENSKSATATRG